MTDLVIQIVNYKTKDYLGSLLADLIKDLENSELKYEINILDNNSGDNLLEIENKYRQQNVSFYYSDKNLGFGGGHNFLSKKSNSKYILILNPDIRFIEKRTIDRLFFRISNDEKIKVVGPKLLTEERKPQAWDHSELKSLLAKISLWSGNSYWKNRDKTIEVAWVSGAVFLIEKLIFDKINGFDEKFFLYKEEEDLCLRIRNLGYDILYIPDIKIMHIGSVVAKLSNHMQKSMEYFLKKHFKNKFGYFFFKLLSKFIVKLFINK